MITEWRKNLQRFIFDRPLKESQLIQHRYKIKEILGMGSYGITYLAYDSQTNNFVVLKQLRKTKAKVKEGLLSFRREAEILKVLNHPQVPALLNTFNNDQGCFIVMEWVQGNTFEDLIFRNHYTYGEKDVIKILLELLRIVENFHQKGIIHRDLRIPNIIEQNGKLFIIDFGLACYLTDQADQDPRDHPEKLRMRAVTVKSDLFALGHFALFLLYSTYEPVSKQEKSWEEELRLTPPFKTFLRKLLQLEEPFASATETMARLDRLKQ
jgi:serine/threonine protein kinase, bacterial